MDRDNSITILVLKCAFIKPRKLVYSVFFHCKFIQKIPNISTISFVGIYDIRRNSRLSCIWQKTNTHSALYLVFPSIYQEYEVILLWHIHANVHAFTTSVPIHTKTIVLWTIFIYKMFSYSLFFTGYLTTMFYIYTI